MKSLSIDWQILRELDEMDPSDPPASFEIYSSFRKHSIERMSALERDLKERNSAAIDRESHAIKSSASCIGASQVQILCENIRHASKAANFAEADRLFTDLGIEMTVVTDILDRHFETVISRMRS